MKCFETGAKLFSVWLSQYCLSNLPGPLGRPHETELRRQGTSGQAKPVVTLPAPSSLGAPLGTALAVYRFRGRSAAVVIANALLRLPPFRIEFSYRFAGAVMSLLGHER